MQQNKSNKGGRNDYFFGLLTKLFHISCKGYQLSSFNCIQNLLYLDLIAADNHNHFMVNSSLLDQLSSLNNLLVFKIDLQNVNSGTNSGSIPVIYKFLINFPKSLEFIQICNFSNSQQSLFNFNACDNLVCLVFKNSYLTMKQEENINNNNYSNYSYNYSHGQSQQINESNLISNKIKELTNCFIWPKQNKPIQCLIIDNFGGNAHNIYFPGLDKINTNDSDIWHAYFEKSKAINNNFAIKSIGYSDIPDVLRITPIPNLSSSLYHDDDQEYFNDNNTKQDFINWLSKQQQLTLKYPQHYKIFMQNIVDTDTDNEIFDINGIVSQLINIYFDENVDNNRLLNAFKKNDQCQNYLDFVGELIESIKNKYRLDIDMDQYKNNNNNISNDKDEAESKENVMITETETETETQNEYKHIVLTHDILNSFTLQQGDTNTGLYDDDVDVNVNASDIVANISDFELQDNNPVINKSDSDDAHDAHDDDDEKNMINHILINLKEFVDDDNPKHNENCIIIQENGTNLDGLLWRILLRKKLNVNNYDSKFIDDRILMYREWFGMGIAKWIYHLGSNFVGNNYHHRNAIPKYYDTIRKPSRISPVINSIGHRNLAITSAVSIRDNATSHRLRYRNIVAPDTPRSFPSEPQQSFQTL